MPFKRLLTGLLALVFLVPASAWAGLNAAIDWEVRQNGSANNGGGFKRTASGTDRTLQTGAQVAIDNAVITTSITTNVITFTGGYTPGTADVGNVVHMLTGTNVTVGFYEITSQNGSNTWTVDRNIVTSGTTTNATGNMGGAVDSPATIGAVAIAGNNVFIKYSATAYLMGSSNNVSGGNLNSSVSGIIIWQGYDTTRTLLNTDTNKPLLDANANSMNQFEITGNQIAVNLKITNTNAKTALICFRHDGQGYFLRCDVDGSTRRAFDMEGTGARVFDAYITNSTVGTSDGCILLQSNGTAAIRCVINTPTGAGAGGSAGIYMFGNGCRAEDCIVYSGNSQYGIFAPNPSQNVRHCTVYNQAHRGIGLGESNLAELSIVYGCTEEGFYQGSAQSGPRVLNCAGGANTPNYAASFVSGQVINFKTLTGNPFTNAGGGDFSLDNTTGEGAACRGIVVASPGIGTSSYEDIGAVQHQASTTGAFRPTARTGGN